MKVCIKCYQNYLSIDRCVYTHVNEYKCIENNSTWKRIPLIICLTFSHEREWHLMSFAKTKSQS